MVGQELEGMADKISLDGLATLLYKQIYRYC